MYRTADIGKLTHLLKTSNCYQYLKSKVFGNTMCGKLTETSPVLYNERQVIKPLPPQACPTPHDVNKHFLVNTSSHKRVSLEFLNLLQNHDQILRQNIIYGIATRQLHRTKRASRTQLAAGTKRDVSTLRTRRRRSRSRSLTGLPMRESTPKGRRTRRRRVRRRRDTRRSHSREHATVGANKEVEPTVKRGRARRTSSNGQLSSRKRLREVRPIKETDILDMENLKNLAKTCERCARAGTPDCVRCHDEEHSGERSNCLRPRVHLQNKHICRKCVPFTPNNALIEKVMQALGPPNRSYAANWPPASQYANLYRTHDQAERLVLAQAPKVEKPPPIEHAVPLRKSKSALAALMSSMDRAVETLKSVHMAGKSEARAKSLNKRAQVKLPEVQLKQFKSKKLGNTAAEHASIHELWMNPKAQEFNVSDIEIPYLAAQQQRLQRQQSAKGKTKEPPKKEQAVKVAAGKPHATASPRSKTQLPVRQKNVDNATRRAATGKLPQLQINAAGCPYTTRERSEHANYTRYANAGNPRKVKQLKIKVRTKSPTLFYVARPEYVAEEHNNKQRLRQQQELYENSSEWRKLKFDAAARHRIQAGGLQHVPRQQQRDAGGTQRKEATRWVDEIARQMQQPNFEEQQYQRDVGNKTPDDYYEQKQQMHAEGDNAMQQQQHPFATQPKIVEQRQNATGDYDRFNQSAEFYDGNWAAGRDQSSYLLRRESPEYWENRNACNKDAHYKEKHDDNLPHKIQIQRKN